MQDTRFQVRPVRTYQGAKYPSIVAPASQDARKHHPLEMLLALVLVLGLSMGLIGCFADYKADPCALGLIPRDENGDCPPPDPDSECLPGLMVCNDGSIMVCDEDGEGWTTHSCDAYCREIHGDHAYSTGCDDAEEDPCGCEYDIVMGEMAECTPGDFYCHDEDTLATCVDPWAPYELKNCEEFCDETYGIDSFTYGCDAEAEEPCQCEQDIVDGGIGMCTPGEFYCQDEDTVVVCDDVTVYFTYDCGDFCTSTFGEGSVPTGCDAGNDPENPCGCE